jgi:hypothetical protein
VAGACELPELAEEICKRDGKKDIIGALVEQGKGFQDLVQHQGRETNIERGGSLAFLGVVSIKKNK